MNIIYMLVFFVVLFFFEHFLFSNIAIIGMGNRGASDLNLLVISFIILTGLSLFRIIISRGLLIRRSFLILLFFFAYVALKIIIDTGDMEKLKSMTIATTGGIILFYMIGSMIGFVINKIINRANHEKYYFIMFFLFSGIYLISHSYYIFSTFFHFFSRLGTDYFAISDINGGYQRPANFLIISSIISSVLYINILLIANNYRFNSKKIGLVLYFFIYMANSILSMVLSQMINSNNGLVSIGGILLISLFFHIYLFFPRNKRLLEEYYFRFRNIVLGKIGKRIISAGFITLTCFLILLIFSVKLTGININTLRISRPENGKISSLGSRKTILSNFPIHFTYSLSTPLVGNMQVDTLTTGTGSYAHSFLLSILSHLGIIGFSIIVIYLCFALKELLRQTDVGIYTNGIKIYKVLLFCFSFLIANIANFFTVINLWFLIGLLFSSMKTKRMS